MIGVPIPTSYTQFRYSLPPPSPEAVSKTDQPFFYTEAFENRNDVMHFEESFSGGRANPRHPGSVGLSCAQKLSVIPIIESNY